MPQDQRLAPEMNFTDFVGQAENFGAHIVSVGVNQSLDEYPSLIAVQAFNERGFLESAAVGVCIGRDARETIAVLLSGERVSAGERQAAAAEILPAFRRLALGSVEPSRALLVKDADMGAAPVFAADYPADGRESMLDIQRDAAIASLRATAALYAARLEVLRIIERRPLAEALAAVEPLRTTWQAALDASGLEHLDGLPQLGDRVRLRQHVPLPHGTDDQPQAGETAVVIAVPLAAHKVEDYKFLLDVPHDSYGDWDNELHMTTFEGEPLRSVLDIVEVVRGRHV